MEVLNLNLLCPIQKTSADYVSTVFPHIVILTVVFNGKKTGSCGCMNFTVINTVKPFLILQ